MMKRTKGIIRVLRYVCLSCVIVFGFIVIAFTGIAGADRDSNAQSSTIPWQMFHYNAQHTGQSPYHGPRTAKLKWSYYLPGMIDGSRPKNFSIDSNGNIYVAAADKLIALSADGNLLWSNNLAGSGATAVSNDETTIYTSFMEYLYAYTNAGVFLWSCDEPTDSIHGEPCIATDGTIYFGSWDRNIYALYPDGTLKWTYQCDGSISVMASPTLSNDEATIYVGSGATHLVWDGTLYALNADGTLKWSYSNLDDMRASGAVVGPDDRIYACGSRRVHCFASDGTKLWESEEDTGEYLPPSLSSDGTIYVGVGKDGKVFAIDASNGQTKWSYQTGENPDYDPDDPTKPQYGVPATIVISKDGTIYVGALDGIIHALNPDGTVLWTYDTGKSITEHCPAIGPDGTLVFCSDNKYIYAIEAATPNPPSDLSASVVSSSQINLSWTDNSDNETGFKIERKIGEEGTFSQIDTVGANVTTYNNTDLTPSTTYYYRVMAYNDEGDSSYSNEANATTSGVAPTVTTGSATSVTSSSATLNGTVNPNGASTEYYFEYGTSTSYGSTTTSKDAGSGTSDVSVSEGIAGLSASTTYHFRIVATNSGGTSQGEDKTFTTSASGGGEEDTGGGGGCAIATACYGTSMAEEVKILCAFRDQYLLTCPEGRALGRLYYSISPKLADFIRDKECLKEIVRESLKPFLWIIRKIVGSDF